MKAMVDALKKLAEIPPSSFHVLEPAKAKRLGGKTMVIPGAAEVLEVIGKIAFGESRTLLQIRQTLAADAGADSACPFMTNKIWKLIAWAAQDPAAPDSIKDCAWWRVLKDGKFDAKLPGGEDRHQKLLCAEK